AVGGEPRLLADAGVDADGSEERRRISLAVLLVVGGEALDRASDAVRCLEDHEAAGQHIAAPAGAGHGEPGPLGTLERPAQRALVDTGDQGRRVRRDEIEVPERASVEADADASVLARGRDGAVGGSEGELLPLTDVVPRLAIEVEVGALARGGSRDR